MCSHSPLCLCGTLRMAVKSTESYPSPCWDTHCLHAQGVYVLFRETHSTTYSVNHSPWGKGSVTNPSTHPYIHPPFLISFYQALCKAGLKKRMPNKTLKTCIKRWSCYSKSNYSLKRRSTIPIFLLTQLNEKSPESTSEKSFSRYCYVIFSLVTGL